MSSTKKENKQTNTKQEEEETDSILICWEEWALSMEEHFNALDKFRNNPKTNLLK